MALRLRIDAPYPGESLSSFLGRAAQYYAVPPRELLTQLLGTKRRMTCRDIDLNPPPALEHRLAESVVHWRSPLTDHGGFHDLVLSPPSRTAYCPQCFQGDLAAGRTPYFRNDWIALFVSVCWRHGTPLFPWQDVTWQGARRLPKAWIYKDADSSQAVPDFMEHHLAQLKALARPDTRIYGAFKPDEAFGYLMRLQAAVEKASESPMKVPGLGSTEERLRLHARYLLRAAVGHIWGAAPDAGEQYAPYMRQEEGFDFVPIPECRRIWVHGLDALRGARSLKWRRTYLLFVAKTLAGTREFKTTLAQTPSIELSWRVWWSDTLVPILGLEYRDVFDRLMSLLGRQLDGCLGQGMRRATRTC